MPACPPQVIAAHGPGVLAPSIHEGEARKVLQGIRGMALRANNTELVTGGADGTIICWDITTGNLGRVVKTIQVGHTARSSLLLRRAPAFRAFRLHPHHIHHMAVLAALTKVQCPAPSRHAPQK